MCDAAVPGVLETQIAKGPVWKIAWSILKPKLGPTEIGALWAFTPELVLPALQRTPTHGVDPASCCYLAHVLVDAGNPAVGDEAGEADVYTYRNISPLTAGDCDWCGGSR